jgi:AcrR family transcriptional regulator
VPTPTETGRTNQRRRTRKDLLAAAARLLKDGKNPDMDEVAEAAMVSRATAYRYFPSVEALLVEAPLDGAVPTPDEVFAGDESTDPVARLLKAERALHEAVHRNEKQLRLMLAASLERKAKGPPDDVPVRQNRRAGLIEAALSPARGRLGDAAYAKLTAALSLVFGTESMIVFRDVLGLEEKTARRVKDWTVQALVRAALDESRQRGGGTQ